jgi:hypothetical protein
MRFPKFGPVVATSTALLLSAAAPRVALAQGVPMTNWSVSVDFQSERSLSGNLNGDATGVFAGSPAEISSRTYDEVYGRFARFRVSVRYAIGISNEFRVGFGRSRGGGRDRDRSARRPAAPTALASSARRPPRESVLPLRYRLERL